MPAVSQEKNTSRHVFDTMTSGQFDLNALVCSEDGEKHGEDGAVSWLLSQFSSV